MTEQEKETLKTKAITELYKNKELQDKIQGICINHGIPLQAGIQEDILQTAMEQLILYPTDKFCEAYLDNPRRIFGLTIRIILRNGVYYDNRTPNGHRKSVAQQILKGSNLNTLLHVNSTDNHDEFNLIAPQDEYDEEYEIIYQQMWHFVKQNLSKPHQELLDILLQLKKTRIKYHQKKEIPQLLKIVKELITEYKNEYEWNI